MIRCKVGVLSTQKMCDIVSVVHLASNCWFRRIALSEYRGRFLADFQGRLYQEALLHSVGAEVASGASTRCSLKESLLC